MTWNHINDLSELDSLDKTSFTQAVFIFKHSTSCSISAMALGRIELKWQSEDHLKLKPFFLDLLKYRSVSDEISKRYGVTHQSPQVLMIREGKCIYNASHTDISYEELCDMAQSKIAVNFTG